MTTCNFTNSGTRHWKQTFSTLMLLTEWQ